MPAGGWPAWHYVPAEREMRRAATEHFASGSTMSFYIRTSPENRAKMAGFPSHVGITSQEPPLSTVALTLHGRAEDQGASLPL